MRSPLETFAGLLDRSVQEIAAMAADARTFDISRIGRLADIWDNNTFPLVSAACAARPFRAGRARAGLRWMADLGADRRALMVELDPALERGLPAAAPEPSVRRDYQARVYPGTFPATTEIVAGLAADYDLSDADVRSIAVRPAETGLRVEMILAAPRRFVPSTGPVTRDGSRRPWPAAPLRFTFTGVDDLRFDAADRLGVSVTCGDAGTAGTIGHRGRLRAAGASVWPNDPRWYESAAGRAADAVTPHPSPEPRKAVRTTSLTSQQRAAARALTDLMLQIRLVDYYPKLAATVPVREMCRVAAGAGRDLLAASARHGAAREDAFAELVQRWKRVPPEVPPEPVPCEPASLRYVRYDAPHEEHDVDIEGSAVVVAAVPEADPAVPWRLASERLPRLARFRITSAAFDGVREVHRDAGALTMDDVLVIQPAR